MTGFWIFLKIASFSNFKIIWNKWLWVFFPYILINQCIQSSCNNFQPSKDWLSGNVTKCDIQTGCTSLFYLWIFLSNSLRLNFNLFENTTMSHSVLLINNLFSPCKLPFLHFYFLLPISRETIVFGSNFRSGDFDGFTRFEVSWIRKSHF